MPNTPITPKQFNQMANNAIPPTKSLFHCACAFLVGGGICTLGQLIFEWAAYYNLDEAACGTAVSISLIFLSVLLTGLNVYDNIAKHAGAGTLVPITGFANAVASPALEFKSEGLILGLAAKMFVIAGPVIVYGVTAGWVYGLIIFLLNLY